MWKPAKQEEADGTSATMARKALSKEDAWKWIAGDDKRPLLVLREFDRIDHPDNPVLSRKLFSDKSSMMSHWFRCVRLPHTVSEPNHPFHNLFSEIGGQQLFLATPDGKLRVDITVKGSQSALYKSMEQVLGASYETKISPIVRKLPKLMSQLDRFEVEVRNLKDMVDGEIERKGPTDARVQRLRAQLKAAEKKVAELKAEKKALMTLKFRKPAKAEEQKESSTAG